MDERILDRRQLTLRSALRLLSGVAITVSGCGGSGGGPPGASGAITSAQLMGGTSLSLNIRGSATHPHTIDLAAAEVMSIASGQRVSKTSSNEDAHTHTVTFN